MHAMSLCSSGDNRAMEDDIRCLYTRLALHPEQEFGWGRGKENARRLGYDDEWLTRLPEAIWESSAAVGNPFSIGAIHPGEAVVDLGCGAGTDVCIAALLVGPSGQVVGVDVTPAMVEKARTNAALARFHNVEIIEADIAALPCPDSFADVVLSNGAINLSPRKTCVLKEALRVLKPGGRLYIADMTRDVAEPVPDSNPTEPSGSWANCVSGTVPSEHYLEMLLNAGFEHVAFVGVTGYRTSAETVGALFRAVKVGK